MANTEKSTSTHKVHHKSTNHNNPHVIHDSNSKAEIAQELESLGVFSSEQEAAKRYWRFAGVLSVLIIGGFLLGSLAAMLDQPLTTSPMYYSQPSQLSYNSNINPRLATTGGNMNQISNPQSNDFAFAPNRCSAPQVTPTPPLMTQIPNEQTPTMSTSGNVIHYYDPNTAGDLKEFNSGNYKLYQQANGSLILTW